MYSWLPSSRCHCDGVSRVCVCYDVFMLLDRVTVKVRQVLAERCRQLTVASPSAAAAGSSVAGLSSS